MSDEPRKSPEAAPEGPGTTSGSPGSAEHDDGRWITAAEAARLVDRSERATRDWLERHEIPALGERPRLFSETAIREQLPAPAPEAPGSASGSPRKSPEEPPEVPGSAGERGTPIEVPYRVDGESPAPPTALVPLSTMLRELESFAERIESLAVEVGTLRSDLAHVTSERDELRRRAEGIEAVEAERDELQSQLTSAVTMLASAEAVVRERLEVIETLEAAEQRRIQAEAERDELRGRVEALEAQQTAAEAAQRAPAAPEAERDELRQHVQAYAASAEFAAGMHPEPSTAVEEDDLAHVGTPGGAATGRPGVFRRWWTWLAGGGV